MFPVYIKAFTKLIKLLCHIYSTCHFCHVCFDRMNISEAQGSYYSTFVWRFANPIKNPTFREFILEPFDAGYMITCVTLVILGSCGMFLNGRAVYNFCRSKTVR